MALEDWVGRLERRPVAGYGLAVALSALALAVRYKMTNGLPENGYPFLTFFPAVILTAFIAGTGPAILSAVLSGFAAWYFFIPPFNTFDMKAGVPLAVGFYAFVVIVDIAIIDALSRANKRLLAKRAALERAADVHQQLFRELQHRVSNNLAFVGSLLKLKQKEALHDPASAVRLLEEAEERIHVMGRIHRKLYAAEAGERPIGDHFRELVGEMITTSNLRNVDLFVDMAPVQLGIDQRTALSMLVAELVTNALKHGVRAGGSVSLNLKRVDARTCLLTVRDSGPGFIGGVPAPDRLGMKIMQGLAAQLGGSIAFKSDGGAVAEVSFAA